MDISQLPVLIKQYPSYALAVFFVISLIIFLIAHSILGRGLIYLASRTKTKVDDILVANLRPLRFAWLAPLIFIYSLAYLFPDYENLIKKSSLFLILWVTAVTFNGLLSALNEIYEKSSSFTGVSIQGYLDLVKILVLVVAVIVSITIFTGQSPIVLLTGLGALTAVLLLIFQDTILSVVASIQIATNDLIKEGDWIEVPSYEADGDVVNIGLHTVKIQNFDKTITVIPTYRLIEVAYKNWRGMKEAGGRRIQRSILIDMMSIRFCDEALLERLRKIDLIQAQLEEKIQKIDQYKCERGELFDSPLDGPQITNAEMFRSYIEAYLHNHPDIHTQGMDFIVRSLAPSPTGLSIEVYVFSKATEWDKYEAIQSNIFDHLLAALQFFDLRVFQEPTGLDFVAMAQAR
jgi:miniconductance mechanosensitive channel